MSEPIFTKYGYCPVCAAPVAFNAWGPWLRDLYLCGSCGSVPRERALMHVLAGQFPNWRELRIHESSPGSRGASVVLARDCASYVPSQFDPGLAPGALHPDGWRNENLQAQTFPDGAFDIVVTQDVFEHVLEPGPAIREIARTLAPGGAHICTVPLVRGSGRSRRRVVRQGGALTNIGEPEYHGNPIDDQGSIVTVDWGYDIAAFFLAQSQMPTVIFSLHDGELGIEGALTEVVVSTKFPVPELELDQPAG